MSRIVVGQTEITYTGEQKLNIELSNGGNIILSFEPNRSNSESSQTATDVQSWTSSPSSSSSSSSSMSSAVMVGTASLPDASYPLHPLSSTEEDNTPQLDIEMQNFFDNTDSIRLPDDFDFSMPLLNADYQPQCMAAPTSAPWYEAPADGSMSPFSSMPPEPPSSIPTPPGDTPPPNAPLNLKLSEKRMGKLRCLLRMLGRASLPTMDEHNQVVDQLRRLQQLFSSTSPRQAEQDAVAQLSRTAKVAWDLMSWAKYHQEETELVKLGNVSSILASKTINARMMESACRSSKTRDWASDGRRAARMFLDAVRDRSADERFFALVLLAKNVSSDQLLKIAHFPALRRHFVLSFALTVEERSEDWASLPRKGYSVLDAGQFLGV